MGRRLPHSSRGFALFLFFILFSSFHVGKSILLRHDPGRRGVRRWGSSSIDCTLFQLSISPSIVYGQCQAILRPLDTKEDDENSARSDLIAMIRDCSTPQSFHNCLMQLPGGPSHFLVENPRVAVALLQRLTGFSLLRKLGSNMGPVGIDAPLDRDWPVIWESIAAAHSLDTSTQSVSSSSQLNVYSTASGFAALATLLQMRQRQTSERRKELDTEKESMMSVIYILWNRLEYFEYNSDSRTTKYLSPKQLVSCLVSVHKCCSLKTNPTMATSLLYNQLCARLCQGDAISQLGVYELTNLFRSISIPKHRLDSPLCNPATQQLLISVMRRLRKQSVRNTPTNVASTIRTLIAALDHALQLSSNSLYPEQVVNQDTPAWTTIRHELQTMMFTLLKHVMGTYDTNERILQVRQITLHELGIVAMTARLLVESTDHTDEDDNGTHRVNSMVHSFQDFILAQVLSLWNQQDDIVSTTAVKYASLRDFIRTLSSWVFLEQFLSPSTSYISVRPVDRNKMIYVFGLCLESIVNECLNPAVYRWAKPHDVNSIVRIIAFLPAASLSILRPHYISVGRLLLHEPFMQHCTALELSNFAWFMAYKSKNFFHGGLEDDVILALGNRILQPDVVHSCTPQQACRILSAFTSLHESTTTAMDRPIASCPVDDLLSSLFQCLGEHLLDLSSLSASDLSSAIYSYAKAVYTFDMGIFDQLVDEFASRVVNYPTSCTLRQICQTVWSCGKMMIMESSSGHDDMVEFDEADRSGRQSPKMEKMAPPPYYPSFVQLVRTVVQQAEELTAPDVTQTLWALARCGGLDDDSAPLEPLLRRTLALSHHLNSSERACILWSICKLPISLPRDAEIVFTLTRPLADPSSVLQLIQPQEASIILYALGRMNIRDVEVFRHLTQAILRHHIHTASAQTIANILWAHRTVFIEPPPQLLDRWATVKLPGLVIARQTKQR
jgi:hypothetical protein